MFSVSFKKSPNFRKQETKSLLLRDPQGPNHVRGLHICTVEIHNPDSDFILFTSFACVMFQLEILLAYYFQFSISGLIQKYFERL